MGRDSSGGHSGTFRQIDQNRNRLRIGQNQSNWCNPDGEGSGCNPHYRSAIHSTRPRFLPRQLRNRLCTTIFPLPQTGSVVPRQQDHPAVCPPLETDLSIPWETWPYLLHHVSSHPHQSGTIRRKNEHSIAAYRLVVGSGAGTDCAGVDLYTRSRSGTATNGESAESRCLAVDRCLHSPIGRRGEILAVSERWMDSGAGFGAGSGSMDEPMNDDRQKSFCVIPVGRHAYLWNGCEGCNTQRLVIHRLSQKKRRWRIGVYSEE